MPFDSNGVFSRVMNWTSDQQNGIAIECGRHDAEDNNFAEGFNKTFCRDGRAAATGNFNLGNHKIQNLADGIAATDAVTKGQLDASSAAGVSLNTDQTITGEKTFTQNLNVTKNTASINLDNSNFKQGTPPASGEVNSFVIFRDQNQVHFGGLKNAYLANGISYTSIFVNKHDGSEVNSPSISINCNSDNVGYATCPTPTEDTTGSIQIDTVGARNTKLGNYVTLGTAQTITGNKTFTGGLVKQANTIDYNGIHIQNTQLSKGTPPSSNAGGQFVFQDKDGYTISDRIGGLEVVYGTNGTIVSRIQACEPVASSSNYASIDVSYPASGSPYATAPSTRSDRNNGKDILTRDWIPLDTRIVHTTGNETIAGVKTFTGNIKFYDTIVVRYNSDSNFGGFIRAQSESVRYGTMDGGSGTWNSGYLDLHKDYVTTVASDVNNSIVTTVSKSKAANGYFQLGNGLIVQWGTGTSNQAVTFSKAFTSANSYQLGVTWTTESKYCDEVKLTARSATGFTFAGRNITWIAIGY